MSFTDDAFLGGRLTVRQSKEGYRAGADPVFLAAAVPAKPGETVLELGCGAGVALLCLLARVSGVRVTGVEREPGALALARENLSRNTMEGELVEADLTALPDDLRSRTFDHVMANPPFFDRTDGSAAENWAREAGRGLDTPLADWIDAGIRRVRPSGTFTLIQRAERLPECLAALDDRVGKVTALPLVARQGRAAKLVLIQATKGAKTPFCLLSPLILHEGDRHEKDGESYTVEATQILRNGAALPFEN